VLLGLLAVAGVALAVLLGGRLRRAAIAAALVTGLSVFGAAGYGSGTAARLLLDPLLLALAAGAAVAIPVLLRRTEADRPAAPPAAVRSSGPPKAANEA
jgi:hypothetical protein